MAQARVLAVLLAAALGFCGCAAPPTAHDARTALPTAPVGGGSTESRGEKQGEGDDFSVSGWPSAAPLVGIRLRADAARVVTFAGGVEAKWNGTPPVRGEFGPSHRTEEAEAEHLAFLVVQMAPEGARTLAGTFMTCIMRHAHTAMVRAESPVRDERGEVTVTSFGGGGGCSTSLRQNGLQVPVGPDADVWILAFATNGTGRLAHRAFNATVAPDGPVEAVFHDFPAALRLMEDEPGRGGTAVGASTYSPGHAATAVAASAIEVVTKGVTVALFVPVIAFGPVLAAYGFQVPGQGPVRAVTAGALAVVARCVEGCEGSPPAVLVGPGGAWRFWVDAAAMVDARECAVVVLDLAEPRPIEAAGQEDF